MIPTVFTTAFMLFQQPATGDRGGDDRRIASLAPTLGPAIGGWITDNWSWHWLFFSTWCPESPSRSLVPKLVNFDTSDLSLLKKGDYLGIAADVRFPRLPGIRAGGRPAQELVRRRRDTDVRLDLGDVRHSFPRACVHRQRADRRSARVGGSATSASAVCCSFVTGIGIFAAVFLTPVFLSRVRGFDSLQIGVAVLSGRLFQLSRWRVFGTRATSSTCAADGVRSACCSASAVNCTSAHAINGAGRNC